MDFHLVLSRRGKLAASQYCLVPLQKILRSGPAGRRKLFLATFRAKEEIRWALWKLLRHDFAVSVAELESSHSLAQRTSQVRGESDRCDSAAQAVLVNTQELVLQASGVAHGPIS